MNSALERYPALRQPELKSVVQVHPHRDGWAQAGVFYTVGGRPLDEIVDTYGSDWTYYLRPATAGTAPPSILMAWWAVLYALSQLARYEPAVWMDAINADASVLTVPIEEGLRLAQASLPKLVYHAITGSWGA